MAVASGGLAASQVHDRERRAAERLGPEVEVLVAARDIRAGTRVARAAVSLRRVPVRFAPPDALPTVDDVVGARTSASVAAGGYLTASLFDGDNRREDGALRHGERAVTVRVAAGGELAALGTGSNVDVLVSTETGAGGGRTTMALAGAQLLRVDAAGAYDDGHASESASGSGPTALATLRVSVEQAIYLTAADNFAREIRLLPRPPGDHARSGRTVSQAEL